MGVSICSMLDVSDDPNFQDHIPSDAASACGAMHCKMTMKLCIGTLVLCQHNVYRNYFTLQTRCSSWRCSAMSRVRGWLCSSPASFSSSSSPGCTTHCYCWVARPLKTMLSPTWWDSRTHGSWKPPLAEHGVETSSLLGWYGATFGYVNINM